MTDFASWAATGLTIIAALMTASNLGSRVTGYGFAVFTVGAICWIVVGVSTSQPALIWTNSVLLLVDAFGVWRWLGRQRQVEAGAHTAAKVSEQMPTETLFPVSLLQRATISAQGEEVGHCIDAMAGCRSGRLSYVVMSQGGVAGVGEVLRRLSWKDVAVHDEKLVTEMVPQEIEALDQLARDEWPAR